MRTPIDWRALARGLGYTTRDEMLVALHREVGAPTIGRLLGVDPNSVLDRLHRLGVLMRSPGGRNNVGHQARWLESKRRLTRWLLK
jgi:hypothetical protein